MVNSVKKILISIQNNNIIFSYKTNNSSISNDLINTNIISNNELIFSDIYIKENSKRPTHGCGKNKQYSLYFRI